MRNRAKCKLCEDIIESGHRHDYVTCKCGEISVDGGSDYHRCRATNWDNFLIVDDEGNTIIPKIVENDMPHKIEDVKQLDIAQIQRPNRAELLDMLDEMRERVDRLPVEAIYSSVTQADFNSLLILLSAILRAE